MNCKHKAIESATIQILASELDKFGEQENIQVIATQVFFDVNSWKAMIYYKEV